MKISVSGLMASAALLAAGGQSEMEARKAGEMRKLIRHQPPELRQIDLPTMVATPGSVFRVGGGVQRKRFVFARSKRSARLRGYSKSYRRTKKRKNRVR